MHSHRTSSIYRVDGLNQFSEASQTVGVNHRAHVCVCVYVRHHLYLESFLHSTI